MKWRYLDVTEAVLIAVLDLVAVTEMSLGSVLSLEEGHLDNRSKPIEYIVTESGCWECISHAPNSGGYPLISRNYYRTVAHRYVYEFMGNSIEPDMLLCHSCDNRICINPAHMFQGTHGDNALDRERKGRGVDNSNRRDQLGRYC